jgi:Tellurite resistance protein TerB
MRMTQPSPSPYCSSTLRVAATTASRIVTEGVIERALARRFDLDQTEVARLVKAADEGALQATDLFHFPRVVVNNYSNEYRIGVIEMLWEVAYADGVLTGDEDTLIRQVAVLDRCLRSRSRGREIAGQRAIGEQSASVTHGRWAALTSSFPSARAPFC